jgi:predicted KAP-like P-loop ATPase
MVRNTSDKNQLNSKARYGYDEKPLIFFSVSHKDKEWYNRLKSKLAVFDVGETYTVIDSELMAGDNFPDELALEINRAQLAVILLSPEYINSKNNIIELEKLVLRVEHGRPYLFPVVLRQCPWQELTFLKETQVWSEGKPIAELDNKAADSELDKIVTRIVELLQPEPQSQSTEFRFSESTKNLLRLAKQLAKDSNRAGVTSSCFLFTLAESGNDKKDAAGFFRDAVQKNEKKYQEEFLQFKNNSDVNKGKGLQDGGKLLGKVSDNTLTLLKYAEEIAIKVSDFPEIHQRHLLAALLTIPDEKLIVRIRNRLEKLDIELPSLCKEFRQFIFQQNLGEKKAAWDDILGSCDELKSPTADHKPIPTDESQSSPFVVGTAGYTSEFCGLGGSGTIPDHLNVESMACRLAELIAHRDTKLPLAVGLFGNWGSGKSHFMNLMDRNIQKLAQETPEDWRLHIEHPDTLLRPDPLGQGPWCQAVVPIYFNAWHYVDTNLWASLVSQIFDSLFVHLHQHSESNALEELQKQLELASGATAHATDEVLLAEAATQRADINLKEAGKGFLRLLLPSVEPDELKQKVTELLGKEQVETVEQLNNALNEARSLVKRVQMFWNVLWNSKERKFKITYFFVAVLIVPILTYFAVDLTSLKESISKGIVELLTGISALLLWTRPILTECSNQLKPLEKWLEESKKEQKDKIEEANNRLKEAKARENQLREEVESLSPEKRLLRFIEQRGQSSDYRGQLGLVSLARRDFQELSNIFATKEERKATITLLEKSYKDEEEKEAKEKKAAAKVGATTEEVATAKKKEAEAAKVKKAVANEIEKIKKIQQLSKPVDRIVLFVDDLDRCQPEKVVDVLQAVHLLLTFPLFAVVVGVDQRCLRQSLQMQFKGLLVSDMESKQENGQEKIPHKDEHLDLATSLDYLEKIFHIPFHLPTMDENGFGNLIEKLTELPNYKSEPESETELFNTPPNMEKMEGDEKTVNEPKQPSEKAASNRLEDNYAAKITPSINTVSLEPVIGIITLYRWERDALKDYHFLIHTPRGAKRLLNTYQLVRAGIPKNEWGIFCGDRIWNGEFRLAMLLLAAAAGYPAVARKWFDVLRKNTTPTEFDVSKEDIVSTNWGQFKMAYDEYTSKQDSKLLNQALLVKWLDRVERFTF